MQGLLRSRCLGVLCWPATWVSKKDLLQRIDSTLQDTVGISTQLSAGKKLQELAAEMALEVTNYHYVPIFFTFGTYHTHMD